MVIKINGKNESIDKQVNLMELISARGLVPEHIVIEHNFRIISKDDWQGTVVKESDNIEIVSFVGGG
ncbi:MAG: sulfur carrier protein ThiS [Candidatus Omnitrophota bacterium]|nr:sulfur carrier protein ThiS [Candidatus Omnitrophota bacterium]